MTMPEEINRIVTDSICDHFFTTSEVANRHLKQSGVDDSRIHFVGNTMIDTLFQNMSRLQQPEIWGQFGLSNNGYFLVTLHRPANVDDPYKLKTMLDAILDGTGDFPIVFPVHPRTRQKLEVIKYSHPRLLQVEPMGYLEFIYMVKNAKGVITDSGGITEETTVMKVPCMTLRDSTERPETVTTGSNELVGTDPANLAPYLHRLLNGEWKKGAIPSLWDGKTSPRIVDKLVKLYSEKAVAV
jgi:UDP-N-acetylglucosamine 2-epimerase (non-hydrolysing)